MVLFNETSATVYESVFALYYRLLTMHKGTISDTEKIFSLHYMYIGSLTINF